MNSHKMTRFFFFSSRRRHTRCGRDWSSDVCSSDLVRTAVGHLMPPDMDHGVILVVSDGDELRPVGPDRGWRLRDTTGFLSTWAEALGTRAVRLLPTGDLGTTLAAELPGLEATLMCPLALGDRPSGDPLVGFVLVAAEEFTLVAL